MTGQHAPLRPHDPRRLGSYELIGRLGQGGMGTVYLARSAAGTLVAVKVVRADLAPDDEFRRRFRSEVDRVRRVPPFCTAEVLDADPGHETPYLVVEYVAGPSLADVVKKEGPLTAANLHSVAIGVATALSAIHGAGIIHRDLKPRNVLLAPGSPKVIDFGIARALDATTGHTRTDQMVGTVAYMSPERFGSEPGTALTPAADVFAWGAVVAYAGTGRTPFNADSPTATAARILTQPPDLSGLTGPLRDLVAHALEKDPANRPTARELLDSLVTGRPPAAAEAALAHQPGLRQAAQDARAATALAGPTVPTPTITPRTRKRPPRLFPLLAGVLVLVLLAAAGVALRDRLGLVAEEEGTAVPTVPPLPGPPPGTLLLGDPLSGTRLWHETEVKTEGACLFSDGALVARRSSPGSFRCRGPADAEPDDLWTEVNVRLLTPGSCASIWFRFKGYVGYQVRVCERAIYLGTHKDAQTEVLKTFPLDVPIEIGGPPTRISVLTEADTAELRRDGAPIGSAPLTDPEITSGRVALGLFTEPESEAHDPPYAVAFDHVAIHTRS